MDTVIVRLSVIVRNPKVGLSASLAIYLSCSTSYICRFVYLFPLSPFLSDYYAPLVFSQLLSINQLKPETMHIAARVHIHYGGHSSSDVY